jgi:hypothetical protein
MPRAAGASVAAARMYTRALRIILGVPLSQKYPVIQAVTITSVRWTMVDPRERARVMPGTFAARKLGRYVQ